MKNVLYIFLFFPMFSSAQHFLTEENNMMRPDDEIIKQQVDYKNPGRSGENVLWDFSKLHLQNEAYKLSYIEDKNNKIRGTEHNTRYYYELRGSSLFRTGYENATTLSVNEQAELLMKFPVYYRDSTFDYYNGNGRYSERLKISAMGTIKTKADAYGMMILPNKDTLKNVLRIHTVKKIAESTEALNHRNRRIANTNTYVSPDSINARIENDTILLEVENYQWFAKGYRYPVFETVKSMTNKRGQISDFFDVAFFYPPQEHYYLEDDPENSAELEDNSNGLNHSNDDSNNNEDADWGVFTYNIYPNPVHDVLALDYFCEKPAEVIISIYNMQRNLLYNKRIASGQNGVYDLMIHVGGYVPGSYLLKIDNGHEVFNEVIIKY